MGLIICKLQGLLDFEYLYFVFFKNHELWERDIKDKWFWWLWRPETSQREMASETLSIIHAIISFH